MEASTNNPSVEEGKTIAIISYITLIGLIIAFVMNNEKKNDFAAFHIRQSLGLVLLYLALWVLFFAMAFLINIPFLSTVLYLGLAVLWILGLLAAIQGEKKPIPVVGTQFQEWFKGIG
ncbi:DUF4870 domain-containing protein [Altibacter sp. HG106]|uniref:DUF4870 domain-containing protein n=1 Tax=Altibacter sp. HG106 TaxID=3023937 RepID=UPI002350842A|nr:hypothetical protein [Altibacter sp. HG106]MDC7993659.1 hypothetical protein [Altibacter sp. HG106]